MSINSSNKNNKKNQNHNDDDDNIIKNTKLDLTSESDSDDNNKNCTEHNEEEDEDTEHNEEEDEDIENNEEEDEDIENNEDVENNEDAENNEIFDQDKNSNDNFFSDTSDDFSMNIILGQILKEAFKLDNTKNGLYPVGFDLKIEKYDDGKLKSEKNFGIKNGSPWFSSTISPESNKDESNKDESNKDESNKDESNKDESNKDESNKDESNKDESNKDESNKEESNKDELNKDELNKDELNEENKLKQTNEKKNESKKKKLFVRKSRDDIQHTKNKINKVDYSSSIGDEKYLNEWIKANLDSNNKFNGNLQDYSTESIDNASSNGKINILNWWLNANKEYGIELKYTEKAINFASKFDYVEILDWWAKSGLALKYNSNAIDYASIGCKIKTLNWWLNAKNKHGWRFEYTTSSIDNAKLDEQKLLKLLKWWKSTMTSNQSLKFKYTREFIDYLESWGYDEVYKYLQENKMISQGDKFNGVGKKNSNMLDFLGMLGMPISIGTPNKTKESISSKYDLNSLPEDIQKHIREKEEELSNNMLINGKAKEYIDNLVKIPFGKYKIEKIFTFIEDFIKKINSINSTSINDYIKTCKITNESDIVSFFEKTKFFSENTYSKYSKLFDEFVEIRKKYITYVNSVLDDTVYGHNATKKHIKCIISQWLSGGFKTGIVIGIQGPPGVGKTTMIKGALSKCLIDYIDYNLDINEPYINQIDYTTDNNKENKHGRPFCFMSLGGTTNGSTLSGHNITYHGATSGDIVKNLKEAKIMNPILYFDELDKISNTEHGHEISSVLTHITDPIQNSHFTDRYFAEVKIDLSKCIIVFSYNDTNKIDRILLDRIQEIRLNPIKHREKLVICKKFIIPEICSQLGYNVSDIDISDNKLDLIISEYTLEAGVRKLKEKLYEIFRMNHLDLIENIENKRKLSGKKEISFDFINDTFSDYPKITYKKIKSSNMIGCINGLYASSSGIGGITPIQAKQIFSKENLAVGITGSVEKVMEESVKVAKTVAWNLLNREEQDNVINSWNSRGIHVHFPDGSTPKDGPSAGTAITCAIYSLLTNKSIKNNVAITGEIDLDGNVTQIGGLDAKLNGAKRAGVKLVLVPDENHRELEIVKKNNPELVDKNFKVLKIKHVNDALKYIF